MNTNGPRPVIGLPLYQATRTALENLRAHLPKGQLVPPAAESATKAEKEFVEKWAAVSPVRDHTARATA